LVSTSRLRHEGQIRSSKLGSIAEAAQEQPCTGRNKYYNLTEARRPEDLNELSRHMFMQTDKNEASLKNLNGNDDYLSLLHKTKVHSQMSLLSGCLTGDHQEITQERSPARQSALGQTAKVGANIKVRSIFVSDSATSFRPEAVYSKVEAEARAARASQKPMYIIRKT